MRVTVRGLAEALKVNYNILCIYINNFQLSRFKSKSGKTLFFDVNNDSAKILLDFLKKREMRGCNKVMSANFEKYFNNLQEVL